MIHRAYFSFALFALLGLGACSSDSLNNENGSNQAPTVNPSQGATASRAFGGFPVPAALPVNEGIWMAGDLHVHTNYSTDASNRPMNEVIAIAKSNGLDYLGVTDHDNQVNGDLANNTWADPDYKSDDELVVLYGAEWTTGKGHANTFSASPYDHQALYAVRDGQSIEVQQVVNSLGIHFSANHPASGDPWGYGYDVVRSIEVWQSAVWLLNTNAQTIWDDQIRTGRRMTGRGGSDSHHGYIKSFPTRIDPNNFQPFVNAMGTPTTWVRAREKTGEAVVEALNAGRVSISATPRSPRLVLTASSKSDGNYDLGMGDNLELTEDREVQLKIDLENIQFQPKFYRANVIRDGSVLTSMNILPGQTSVSFTDQPGANTRTYYRVTMEGVATPLANAPGSFIPNLPMVAISNPIYINYQD
ncbi:CehA/McbA family metallohydrolase [Limnobacter parvus]|uniref:CehA/McbA family metallohydrolase n=1 Tax=Limnobacter parvus TaxID=2939690 RepID=A0ABT1XIM7_9BURK|nr:CehA/McbA family metallohydrolase [Limnobacter parvus]MCR2747126.1 CehA/McbA family metallohydrolase [Limnobacter parvus]